MSALSHARKRTLRTMPKSQRGWSTLSLLPLKAPISVQPQIKAPDWTATDEPKMANTITVPLPYQKGGAHTFRWLEKPRNVLLIKKKDDERVEQAFNGVIKHIQQHYPHLNIIVEAHVWRKLARTFPSLYTFADDDQAALAAKTDLVITLGGDGSILHVSSLFSHHAIPPVLSFSMGTLGFLLPYDIQSFPEALADVMASRFTLLLRMRMCLTLWGREPDEALPLQNVRSSKEVHFMNEMVFHRGHEPHMTTMDAFVNGEHLTRTVADGLIVSTPTGSTAYSLSAGGPIVHPSVSTLVLTPISPRSLSFRTILLPGDAQVQVFVSPTSRSQAHVSVDGKNIQALSHEQSACIQMSPYPLSSIVFSREANMMRKVGPASTLQEHPVLQDDWVHDINTRLRFNTSFTPREAGVTEERAHNAYFQNIRAPYPKK